MPDYLHNHKDFKALLTIIADEKGIDPALIEKDYWIMHCLYGLKKQGFKFELKGGTSLSKGHRIIHRFSEDIDIHIEPPREMGINQNPKNTNPNNIEKRKDFYNWLATEINIPGISSVSRDLLFDDEAYYRSGGIRLHYESAAGSVEGLKEGILLEAGFDNVTPNTAVTISSWAYDRALTAGVEIIDNRAIDIPCYHIGYTFVEKLQTIATKFRKEQEFGDTGSNFMRQYYDVYCLLDHPEVIEFIGSEAYQTHKENRFPAQDKIAPLCENGAFLLSDPEQRQKFKERYTLTATLYYQGQPDFEDLLERIAKHLKDL
jgi:hypothetical protein